MDTRTIAILGAGILVTLLLLLVDIYLAGIAFIILVVLVMSLMIMKDSTFLPQINVRLRDDAKAVVLTNTGNSPAVNIHATLVPLDIEYNVASLAVEESHEYTFPTMLTEVKVVVTFANEKGQLFSHSQNLSATGEEFDPLKPMIPVFGWK